MKTRKINPSQWLLHFNLNQAIEVTDAKRTLYLSGQTSNDADGAPLHPGDMVRQFQTAWGNLKQTLAQADMVPSNVVRLNFYTTDMAAFMDSAEALVAIYANDDCQPVCTLVEVASLFEPELMIELEATAVA